MDKLKQNLDDLKDLISDLESQIIESKIEAEDNVKPLKLELSQVRQDKKDFAMKNDFDSVQNSRRREDNLKFKIDAQWNKYFMLKNELSKLNKQKMDLEYQIKLEEDRLKRKNQLLSQMNDVIENYRKTQNLRQAAIDSNINPGTVEQWHEWGRNAFSEVYSDFYNRIIEIDDYFKDLESQELKMQMDKVIEAYAETHNLLKASEMANVSYDTVQYWHDWGKMGFGEENVYFFRKLES